MKTNANSNVLRSEIENEFDTGAASNDSIVATLPPAIIHCRDAADEATLTETFDLSKVAGATKIVHGLANATQLALLNSASKGTKVITTGMPLDVAAQLGEVTVIKTWAARTTEQGNKYPARSEVPVVISVRKVIDREAYDRLKQSEDFAAAFGLGEASDAPF